MQVANAWWSGHRRTIAVAMFLCIWNQPVVVAALVIQVPSQQPTISAGIAAVTDGDTVLVAPGTYTGAGNRNLDFGGKDIVVRSQSGASMCTVDAENLGRAFVFANAEGAGARLEGFTITHGFHVSAGGGIFVSASSPTIVDCVISDNRTANGTTGTLGVAGGHGGNGGGIYVTNGSPRFIGCSIQSNRTGKGGDGFIGSGTVGTAGGSGGSGGGIYVGLNASVTLERCIVADNETGVGGQGGSGFVCIPPLACRTYGENGGNGGDGGGLRTEGVVQAINCLFARNHTGVGGAAGFGIELPLPIPGRGGNGAAWDGGLLTSEVLNCTIAANLAAAAGGAGQPAGVGGGIAGAPTVTNAVIWGNNSTPISVLAQVTYSDVEGGFSGAGNIAANPQFVSQAGGNYRLLTGSPCADAGDGTVLAASVTTDLDGNPRLLDGDLDGTTVVDMGAYELHPVTSDVAESGATMITLAQPHEPVDGGPVPLRYRVGPGGSMVQLDIFDVAGRRVRTLANGWHTAGEHLRWWDRRSAAGTAAGRGIYFVCLRTPHVQDSRKLVLLRR